MSSADGKLPDDDPVRLSPPADPWLTEAPTSAQVPLADTARFDEQPSGGTAAPAPPRRRAGRRLLTILAVCALLIAGLLAVDQFGSDDDSSDDGIDARPPAAAPSAPAPSAPAPSTAAPAARTEPAVARQPQASTGQPVTGGPVVVYEVTASGARNTGSVDYTDQDGEIIRLNGIALPWKVTFTVTGQRKPLVLISQRKSGGDAGPVTCTITYDGKLLSSTTADGRYASAQCSG